jgi:hypothetical protein
MAEVSGSQGKFFLSFSRLLGGVSKRPVARRVGTADLLRRTGIWDRAHIRMRGKVV